MSSTLTYSTQSTASLLPMPLLDTTFPALAACLGATVDSAKNLCDTRHT